MGEIVSERRTVRLDVVLAGWAWSRSVVEVALYGTTLGTDSDVEYDTNVIRLTAEDAVRFASVIADTRGAVHTFRDADLSSRTISVLRALAPGAGSDSIRMHTVVQVQDDGGERVQRRVSTYVLPNIATARDTAREIRDAVAVRGAATTTTNSREG